MSAMQRQLEATQRQKYEHQRLNGFIHPHTKELVIQTYGSVRHQQQQQQQLQPSQAMFVNGQQKNRIQCPPPSMGNNRMNEGLNIDEPPRLMFPFAKRQLQQVHQQQQQQQQQQCQYQQQHNQLIRPTNTIAGGVHNYNQRSQTNYNTCNRTIAFNGWEQSSLSGHCFNQAVLPVQPYSTVNLLNDSYEKNLLNQTTHNMVNLRQPPTGSANIEQNIIGTVGGFTISTAKICAVVSNNYSSSTLEPTKGNRFNQPTILNEMVVENENHYSDEINEIERSRTDCDGQNTNEDEPCDDTRDELNENSEINSDCDTKHRVAPIGGELCESDCDKSEVKSVCDSLDPTSEAARRLHEIYEDRNHRISFLLETAQATAAYYARNSHKMSNHPNGSRQRFKEFPSSEHGGFSGIIQREPPALPAGLARRLANKENYGLGKVKVMLRIFDKPPEPETASFMLVDKKKRQVALTDINALPAPNSSIQPDRGPMVAAPKLFAFDNLFTCDDAQLEVCASALSEVIPAVLEGSDGCLLTLGYPKVGQSKTMVGGLTSTELGAIPCAISWLYRGINERRQKSGARFSVRVSALGVSATKPATSSKDLLASYATDGDESSGYLRDDFLGGPTELRAPTAERAAHYFDAALAKRNALGLLEPALIFTLHVYQYSLHGKGGVAGGRSRLHLIDLGGCANRNGGLPLSGIGNVLLSILSGQKHPPNRDHPLTPLLKDCLAPLTCHVSILAHVAHSQTYADALTTIQLASRIHRLRRRKHRYPLSLAKAMGLDANGHPQSGGSSEGPDPSSSDFSADTVIYMGPHHDEATDGEHPPVYIPSLSSGDNRCVMSKALKGSSVEKTSKLPMKKSSPKIQSPTITQRTDSLKRNDFNMEIPPSPYTCPKPNPPLTNSLPTTPKMMASPLRHQALNSSTMGINKGCNVPTPKNSPLRRPQPNHSESPKRTVTEEQWIDGPRISKLKAAEARHMMREIQHVKQCETWIDGPKSTSPKKSHSNHNNNSLVQIPNSPSLLGGYGFMDQHKKTMIRQWVENQSTHILQQNSPNQPPKQLFNASQFKIEVDDDQISVESNSCEFVNPINSGFQISKATVTSSDRVNLKQQQSRAIDTCPTMQQPSIDLISNHSNTSYTKPSDSQEEEDQDSGPSEVPPALPLMEPLGSREVSHDSIHMLCSRHMSRESIGIGVAQTTDCGLQVTEEEIAKAMGCEHPLSALSIGDISIVSSFNVGDAFSDCVIGDRQRNQFDQLARLREIFTSQLAMAEVTPVFRINDDMSVFSEPAFRFSCGPESVCSEPVYRAPSPKCRDCRQSAGLSRTPSKGSLPSLTGIMAIAGMEQYANLRHPDGASDPNLQHKSEKNVNITANIEELDTMLLKQTTVDLNGEHKVIDETTILTQPQLSPLPLSTPEAYDSGHDSSTPRTSKHSGISRRAESGYHSVATVRDSDESSFGSGASRNQKIHAKKMKRNDKSLCNWLRNPFTCTYPDTEGEVSDF